MPTLKLRYKTIFIPVAFSLPTSLPTPGGLLFKTVIGKELRKKFCTARYSQCSVCPSHSDCIYGTAFEPVIVKRNAALNGQNRVIHPVIIETDPFVPRETVDLVLRMTFIGSAIKYIPLFYNALKTREEIPLLKTKVTYAVKDLSDGKGSLLEKGSVRTEIESAVWEYVPDADAPPDAERSERRFLVQTQTPLRFRGSRRYTDEFSAKNFMNCLHKRMQNFVTQYGVNDFESGYTISPKIRVTRRDYTWNDLDHYSTRQRKVLKLGGHTGSFCIEGDFTDYEKALLFFTEIFHAGEHTSSGLGRLAIQEIKGTRAFFSSERLRYAAPQSPSV
jgi:hypothetical protein